MILVHVLLVVAVSELYIYADYSLLWRAKTERVHIAHELGHCETGSFYNVYSLLDIRQKYENRADAWAIKKLIPKDELDTIINMRIVDYWDLAEYFNVTDEFMYKAITYYQSHPGEK